MKTTEDMYLLGLPWLAGCISLSLDKYLNMMYFNAALISGLSFRFLGSVQYIAVSCRFGISYQSQNGRL